MPGRRQGCRPQPARDALPRQHENIELVLQVQVAVHPHPAGKADELCVAGQKDMLAVVHLESVDLKRRRPSSEEAAAFEELNGAAHLLEFHRGGEAGDPRAHDVYAKVSHAWRATRSFSAFESEAR